MHRVFLFEEPERRLDVQVIVQHRLHALSAHVGVHLADATTVVDFELFVATFPIVVTAVLAFVVTDTGRDACRNLRSGNLHDAVTEFLAFAARDRNAYEREENAISAKHLAEFAFMDVERANLIVVHDRTKTRAAEAHFGMRILLLQVVNVEGAREGVTAEVRKSKQSGESATAHAAHKGSFLRIKAVREHALVTEQVKLFVTLAVVRFLEDCHVVDAAFVQVLVFVDVYRVDFDAHELKVFAGELASFADVFDAALCAAFAGQQQDFFHAAIGDDLHFVFDLFHRKLHALDVVVAVKAAIDTVVFAVVRNIERSKQINVVAEVTTRLDFSLGGHFFEERCCGGRKQSLEVFDGASVVLQGELHIAGCVLGVIEVVGLRKHLVADVGLDDFHSRQVFHDVRTDRRIVFNPVLAFKRSRRKVTGIKKVIVVFSFNSHFSFLIRY